MDVENKFYKLWEKINFVIPWHGSTMHLNYLTSEPLFLILLFICAWLFSILFVN